MVVVVSGTVDGVVVVAGTTVVAGATVVVVGAVIVVVTVAGADSLDVQAEASSATAIAMAPSRDMRPEHTVGHTVLASNWAAYGSDRRQNGER